MTNETLCYNKGCGKSYDPNENGENCCTYHPGIPVFHDALKGWSCCKRRTTDFSDFLNIPGCSKGCHSNVKPQQPIKPKVSSSRESTAKDKLIVEQPTLKPVSMPIKPMTRPSSDEPTIPLTLKSTPSIKKALEKLTIHDHNSDDVAKIKICKHLSCNVEYSDGISEDCVHHPGVPIFHEGMKYWSCCTQKTSDFTAFLAQKGCAKGTHEWKLKSGAETTMCRYDWHQTGSVVVLSIFAKTAVAENSTVNVNQVKIDIDLEYEGGKRNFKLDVELEGVIDPGRSFVTLFGTKVEITLKKADASHWKNLALEKSKEAPDEEACDVVSGAAPTKQDENGDAKIGDDDSDLSGIDDVEFD